jgi:hypothetical protein
MLSAVQMTAYKLTSVQESVLTHEQNQNLAVAMQRVLRHYPMVVSEKTQDIMALAFVAGNIAFTQFTLYSQRTHAGHLAQ